MRRAGQLLADIRPNVKPGQSTPILTPAKKNDFKGFNRRPRKLPPSELPAAVKLTDKLVRVAAGTSFTPKRPWKHTETLRGDEMRLLEKIAKSTIPRKSEIQAMFAADVEDADPAVGPEDVDASETSNVEIGSLVEVRKWVYVSFLVLPIHGRLI